MDGITGKNFEIHDSNDDVVERYQIGEERF